LTTPAPTSAPARRRTTGIPARVLARHAVDALLSKKGLDVRVMDLRGVSGVADVFVIATGESELQVRAMVEAVREGVQDATGERPWHTEGTDHHQWVVLDYVDLVVHVFMPERRSFYGLERLWGDAPSEEVPETGSGDTVALLRDDAPAPKAPPAAEA
jgi:ribosome-associated protein